VQTYHHNWYRGMGAWWTMDGLSLTFDEGMGLIYGFCWVAWCTLHTLLGTDKREDLIEFFPRLHMQGLIFTTPMI